MKVYVMTKAQLFGGEEYIGVKSTMKDAKKALREKYPFMRENNNGEMISDAENKYLLFIHEVEV